MRTIALLLAPLFVPGRPLEDVALRFEPEDGTVLKRTFEAHAEYERTDAALSIDGEPVEGLETRELSMVFDEHIAVSDDLRSVADGRPTELVRTFDDLSQETVFTSGEESQASSSASDLEGRAVRFKWSDDDYEVATADDGDELDEHVTDWLDEDMDLRRVLPAEDVAVGDEWEVDPRLYLAFMWPSGLLEFRDDDEQVTEQDREMNRETIERLQGTGTARLEEVREEDGLRLAVIHVELAVTTGCDGTVKGTVEVEEGEEEEYEVAIEVEIERKIQGTILWDLEHGHAHSAELEAEASRQTTRTRTVETEDGEVEVEESEMLEGTIKYDATFERAE